MTNSFRLDALAGIMQLGIGGMKVFFVACGFCGGIILMLRVH